MRDQFVHAAPALGVGVFFAPTGWRVQLLRTHGDLTRGYNGALSLEAAPNSTELREPPFDLSNGLRCALGHDLNGATHRSGGGDDGGNAHAGSARHASACRRDARRTIRTRWGDANLSVAFAYGARYYVCLQTLNSSELVRRSAADHT